MTLSRLNNSVDSSFVATAECWELPSEETARRAPKETRNGVIYMKQHQRAEPCSRVLVYNLARGAETRLRSRDPANDGLSYADIESRDPADDENALSPHSFSDSSSAESSITMGPANNAEYTRAVVAPTMRRTESECGESEDSGSRTISSYVSLNSQRSTPEGLIICFATKKFSVLAEEDAR